MPHFLVLGHIWCDVMRSSKMSLMSGTIKNVSFVIYLWKHSKSFALLKTSSKSDLRFQKCRQFWPAENNKILGSFILFIGCISKLIFLTYNSFRLITSHIFWPLIPTYLLSICVDIKLGDKMSTSNPIKSLHSWICENKSSRTSSFNVLESGKNWKTKVTFKYNMHQKCGLK